MELTAEEPGMVGQFDHLDQPAIGRLAGEPHSVFGQHIAIGITNLPPVAVPLADLGRAVGLGRPGTGSQPCRVGAQPHGAAHVGHVLLRLHEGDHRRLALGLELGAVGIGQLADIPGELDDRHLESETNA
jgi:hypothetical protein